MLDEGLQAASSQHPKLADDLASLCEEGKAFLAQLPELTADGFLQRYHSWRAQSRRP